ncbi:hypothetical protein [Moorena producens]|uniref:hypothetical protein n=1 Tax=Moorena producens TaxID=1155739 RepID=UPI003C717EDC
MGSTPHDPQRYARCSTILPCRSDVMALGVWVQWLREKTKVVQMFYFIVLKLQWISQGQIAYGTLELK